MENDDLISVIVPVYNVEKYLEKCVNSIIMQTYSNLEILLIDDGSTDKSSYICDDFAKKDKRIKAFHIGNKGVSFARNKGIEEAKGKYIQFVDADDYIEKNMIEILYNNAIKYNADLSTCNIKQFDEKGRETSENIKKGFHVYNNDEYIKNIYDDTMYYGYPINKLFKREYIGKIRFNENISNSEDLLFLFEITNENSKIVYDGDSFLYNYVHRKNSASTHKYNFKNISSLIAMEYIIKNYVDKFSPELKDKYILGYYVENLRAYYLYKKNKKANEYKLKLKEVKDKYYKYLLKSKYISKKIKVKLVISTKFTYLYYFIKYDIMTK